MGQSHSNQDHFCKFPNKWTHRVTKRHSCCIVNPSNTDEIIIWTLHRLTSPNIQVIRYNIQNELFKICENHKANNIFTHILSATAKVTKKDEKNIDYKFIFHKMIKYPYSNQFVILFGLASFYANDDFSASTGVRFCALIDVDTMDTVHFQILNYPSKSTVNWACIVQYKNIIFAVGLDVLTICSIGEMKRESQYKNVITAMKQISLHGLESRNYSRCGIIIKSVFQVADSDNETNLELLLFGAQSGLD